MSKIACKGRYQSGCINSATTNFKPQTKQQEQQEQQKQQKQQEQRQAPCQLWFLDSDEPEMLEERCFSPLLNHSEPSETLIVTRLFTGMLVITGSLS